MSSKKESGGFFLKISRAESRIPVWAAGAAVVVTPW